MNIRFAKASGAGNDFVLINNLSGELTLDQAGLARMLCARHVGIGADGLIVLEKSAKADIRMMYYNADGSYGGMCGNGGRCAAAFAHALGVAGSRMTIEALDFIYEAEMLSSGRVRLHMKNPARLRTGREVSLDGRTYTVHTIDTGAPHVILFVDDLANEEVDHKGRGFRYHEAFAPEGSNVNFVKMTGASSVSVRTYERGVEAETLACGTGSVASAILASVIHGIEPPVAVKVQSGETLDVGFIRNGVEYTNIILEGGASILFRGNILIDSTGSIISTEDLSDLNVTP
jgi:diaminopimelate epimerase